MTCKGSGKTRTRNMRQRSRRLGKEIDVSPFNLSAFRENHSQNETFLSWSTGWYSKRETTLKAKILTHLNRYVGFSEFQLNKNNNRIKYWCVPVWDSGLSPLCTIRNTHCMFTSTGTHFANQFIFFNQELDASSENTNNFTFLFTVRCRRCAYDNVVSTTKMQCNYNNFDYLLI